MLHGIYSEFGPRKDLRTHGALLRQDPDNADKYLAQLDPHYVIVRGQLAHCKEAFGWHSFPKSHFTTITGEE